MSGDDAASRRAVSSREELGSPEAAASGKEDSRAGGGWGGVTWGKAQRHADGWGWKTLSFKEADGYETLTDHQPGPAQVLGSGRRCSVQCRTHGSCFVGAVCLELNTTEKTQPAPTLGLNPTSHRGGEAHILPATGRLSWPLQPYLLLSAQ